MEQPTHEVTLNNGWKATLVDFFTQGQYEELQGVMLEGVTVSAEGQVSDVSVDRVRKANDLALSLAVRSLTAPDGTVYQGDQLSVDVIKSMPFDPDYPQGQLIDLINGLTGKKKATSAS